LEKLIDVRQILFILNYFFLVKIDGFQKKNITMQNVAPGSYDITLKDKKNEPQWSMGAKFGEIDKRISVSP